METDSRNIRLKLPEATYLALRHLSVDRGITLSELLLEAATRLLEAPDRDPHHTTNASG